MAAAADRVAELVGVLYKGQAASAARCALGAISPAVGKDADACPLCDDPWDVNCFRKGMACCCRRICARCFYGLQRRRRQPTFRQPCALCFAPCNLSGAEVVARARARADGGDPAALEILGTIHLAGEFGLEASSSRATRYFVRAAELGDETAMLQMAALHIHGDGVAKSVWRASEYYRAAVAAGSPHGLYFLGQCYANGDGVDRDVAEAARLWRVAASVGYTRAEVALAGLHWAGFPGHPPSVAAAAGYYARAADKGDLEAKKCLATLKGNVPTWKMDFL